MKKTIIFSFVIILAGFISCKEDFLDQQPVGAFGEAVLSSEDGIKGLLIGVYDAMKGGGMTTGADGQLFGTIHGGESFKGSDAGDQPAMLEYNQFGITTGNGNSRGLWTHGYNGVGRCNLILKLLPDVDDLTEAEKTSIEAETRFLRAYFYFYLKRAFVNIPWVSEEDDDVRVPNTVDNDGQTYVNVWPQIVADMDFARKNLPATQDDLGRPNKWAADIFYAKMQIYRANYGDYPGGYAEALTILTNAINNGVTASGEAYDLEPYFHDNFNCTTENGPEFVWGTQCSANDGTSRGDSNGDPKSVWIQSQSKSGPGLGRGWGFNNPTPFFADMFRTDANGLPYLDYYDTNPNRLKDDYGLTDADPFEPDTMGVDPRLDWTIIRRGIPALDYGYAPGASWIRNQSHGGPYMVKKWYIWKSEDGTFTAPGRRNTAMNIPTIRFADVLLMAAECEARVGSLDNARALVNRVRQRMVDNSDNPMNWVKKYVDGTTNQWSTENAANYRISLYPTTGDPFQAQATALEAILYERALELGTEGHRYWDVVRFGMGEEIFNFFLETEKSRFDYLSEGVYTDVPDSYHPIPRDAIDRSQKGGVNTLTQNPGY